MFGNVLKTARERAGMTQEELAFKADVDRTYVSRLENDRMSPTLDTLFRLADAIGVPAATLVARADRRRNL